jgi:biofilm PGA synthesis lipoprotein PgaB
MLVRLLLALPFLLCSGPTLATSTDEPSLTVISYHEIVDPKVALNPNYAVSPTMFVRHIDWLRNNGFHFVSVDQVIAAMRNEWPLPEKAVLLTFDDGYQSVAINAWPMLQMLRIPSVHAVVTSWQEATDFVNFDGRTIPRTAFMSWQQLRAMEASGLVEIASHSHDLHRGIIGNPQGNLLPATTTRLFDSSTQQYESERFFKRRIAADLQRSATIIGQRTGQKPRVMVWPYGKYNAIAEEIARAEGIVLGLTLEDGGNSSSTSPLRLRRILVENNMDIGDLRYAINVRNSGLTENDLIFDKDPAQQERNLDHLLDRLTWLGVNTVYLQAFADPDANGSADAVYFRNRHIPIRADLFSRVAWQIRTRTPVRRVYAWMPLLAWELPKNHPAAGQTVKTLAGASKASVNMGYIRLSPFSATARQVIGEIFEDLSRYTSFDGIIYHDDITLSDFEDDSSFARSTYREWGLPESVSDIRATDDLVGRWTILKINYLDKNLRCSPREIFMHRWHLIRGPRRGTPRRSRTRFVITTSRPSWRCRIWKAPSIRCNSSEIFSRRQIAFRKVDERWSLSCSQSIGDMTSGRFQPVNWLSLSNFFTALVRCMLATIPTCFSIRTPIRQACGVRFRCAPMMRSSPGNDGDQLFSFSFSGDHVVAMDKRRNLAISLR